MNKNILIVLIGGFVIAILVAVMVQATLSGSKKDVVVERTQILVASKNLKVGHEIEAGDLKWQTWPADTVFPGALIRDGEQQPTDVVNGKLLRSLVEGQPLHMTLVAEEDRGDFLSANITKGMRAVGISVKSHVLADRLIRPGDFVDVMVTYRVRINTRSNPEAQTLVNRYATETVLENVRVLAIDKNDTKAVDEEEEDGKKSKKSSSKKATLTLEVSSEASEKLVLAERMGEIGLALRSYGDNAPSNDDNTTTDVGMSSVMTNLSSMRKTSSGVRIYNGGQMSEVQARNVKQGSGVNFDVQQNYNFDEDQEGPTATVTFGPGALEQILSEE